MNATTVTQAVKLARKAWRRFRQSGSSASYGRTIQMMNLARRLKGYVITSSNLPASAFRYHFK